jgi:hypothetical protein
MGNLPDLPAATPFIAPVPAKPGEPVKPASGFVDLPWILWFQEWQSRLLASPERLASMTLTGQAASIASSPISTGILAAGLYRLSYYARVTQAATVSSSLTVTFGWTDGGVTCTASGAAMVGNTTATAQSGAFVVHADQAAALTYSTTYASVGGVSMEYQLTVLVEGIN